MNKPSSQSAASLACTSCKPLTQWAALAPKWATTRSLWVFGTSACPPPPSRTWRTESRAQHAQPAEPRTVSLQEDGFEHAAQAARIESAKRESKLRAQLAQEAKVSSCQAVVGTRTMSKSLVIGPGCTIASTRQHTHSDLHGMCTVICSREHTLCSGLPSSACTCPCSCQAAAQPSLSPLPAPALAAARQLLGQPCLMATLQTLLPSITVRLSLLPQPARC